MVTNSPWRTIIPGDPSTLPTEADADGSNGVHYMWQDGDGALHQTWRYWYAPSPHDVAWCPDGRTPYTPPETVRPSRDAVWADSAYPRYFHHCQDYREVHPDHHRYVRVLPGDMDPDAAIRLRDRVEKFLGTLDSPCCRFDEIEARNELRDALREASKCTTLNCHGS